MSRSRDRYSDVRIEFPSRGATYCHAEYGVYEYGRYPRHSVLAGQVRRTFLDSFPTFADAKAAYPTAYVSPGIEFTGPFTGEAS